MSQSLGSIGLWQELQRFYITLCSNHQGAKMHLEQGRPVTVKVKKDGEKCIVTFKDTKDSTVRFFEKVPPQLAQLLNLPSAQADYVTISLSRKLLAPAEVGCCLWGFDEKKDGSIGIGSIQLAQVDLLYRIWTPVKSTPEVLQVSGLSVSKYCDILGLYNNPKGDVVLSSSNMGKGSPKKSNYTSLGEREKWFVSGCVQGISNAPFDIDMVLFVKVPIDRKYNIQAGCRSYYSNMQGTDGANKVLLVATFC